MRSTAAALGILWLLAATAAQAITAQQLCETAKLRAAGAELGARLSCEARGLAPGADPACIARASQRRDEAFGRAEARGGCATSGDSEDVGNQVASRVQDFLQALRPLGPAASRCTERELFTASRSAVQLSAIYANAGRARHEEFLVASLARARATASAAYQAAQSQGDCLFPSSAEQIHSTVEYAAETLRDMTCPTCGVLCPCWTAAQLDASFPPGAFDSMGGTACWLVSLGYIEAVNSARGCSIHKDAASASFPRAGFGVYGFLNWCMVSARDLDPDGDGTCGGTPTMMHVGPVEAQVCFDDMKATRIYRGECHVPN